MLCKFFPPASCSDSWAEAPILGPRTGNEPRLSAYPEKATEEQQNGATRSVAPQWPTVPLPYWHCLL